MLAHYKYLVYELTKLFEENKFSWENKPSLSKTKNLKIKIPINNKNEFCLEKQKVIAMNFEKINYVKNSLKKELEKYQTLAVEI